MGAGKHQIIDATTVISLTFPRRAGQTQIETIGTKVRQRGRRRRTLGQMLPHELASPLAATALLGTRIRFLRNLTKQLGGAAPSGQAGQIAGGLARVAEGAKQRMHAGAGEADKEIAQIQLQQER